MTSETLFAGKLLEVSSDFIAGRAARQLVDGDPPQPPTSEGPWKAHLRQRLDELAGALVAGEPRLLREELAWTRSAWLARGQSDEGLRRAHRALEATLSEELPPEAWQTVQAYLQSGANALEGEPRPETDFDPALDPGEPLGPLALEYLRALLEGDRRGALDRILAAFDGGASLPDLYEEVLAPVQREIGEMWHRDEILVAEEHFATTTTQGAMSILSHRAPAEPATGRTAVLSSVFGNPHEMGVRIVADLLENEGWRSIGLGSQVPIVDLLGGLSVFQADLLLLSASMGVHLSNLRGTIEVVRREFPPSTLRIMVGGRAFDSFPELWKNLGADGYARTAREAVRVADQLVPIPSADA